MPRNLLRTMTGLLLVLSSLSAHAKSSDLTAIGRLFHSAEERHALDRLRQNDDGDGGQVAFSSSTPVQQMTLDGFVKRSNGKSTAWINGTPQTEHESIQGVLVRGRSSRSGSAVLQLPSGKSVNLKPGQTYDITNDQVQDAYGMPSTKPK